MNKLTLVLAITMGFCMNVQAGDPAAGKALTVTCAACHGEDGNSAVPTFPKLAGQNENYLIKQWKKIDRRKASAPSPALIHREDGLSHAVE